ncbi:MAG: response regulator transcription factor [Peptostreptococcaceae bacterium]|nr:response regulator transcription factor [Peptostreptococcaceae bacterium]
MNAKIYVADDEKNIRELIRSFLEEEQLEVRLFENGDSLLAAFEQEPSDLVILDVMMPGTDGFSICSAIRKKSDVPIILLTARDTDADYVTGFTLGCDDYFTKPFSPVKLTMRVKAMLKRLVKDRERPATEELSFGDITLHPMQKTAYCKNNELKLTNTEYALLSYMIEHKDKAISRDELLQMIWGYDNYVETRVTDDTIKRLRKKISAQDSNLSIETVWGFGFKLSLKDTSA